jgi:hypothetical protein
MVRDDMYPNTVILFPPEDDDRAIERVQELSSPSLTRLVQTVFHSPKQLQTALAANGFSMDAKPWSPKGLRVESWRGVILGSAPGHVGTKYGIAFTFYCGWVLKVDNVWLIDAGWQMPREVAEAAGPDA